ncbi:phospholipase [Aliidiomarina iranensis]|uniref:phospholipase D n=1 Tax=Aliidiomarina iranensis TaxID=1434071 RepID=A0A432W2V3_9GAMM|nr:phospholipase D-like domain-containing protein [Aliidiomarina iranensis]RUO23562.1 phospholipase [Aliidiomarina iranensis]
MTYLKKLILLCVLITISVGIYNAYKPLPSGLDFSGSTHAAKNAKFLFDSTYLDARGERKIEQQIFDEVLAMIANAREFVLVDMFLFNNFQGELGETYRPLSSELTAALIAHKQQFPQVEMHVISDPLNSLYGGRPSPQFAELEAAGITVTLTNLSRLRDSNPLYSAWWRIFAQPFANSEGTTLPNPFTEGRVSLRSYLALLNFKANHRKVILADNKQTLNALVTSANPHDGSSAHSNVALRFSGAAAWDLLATEAAVLAFSDGPEIGYGKGRVSEPDVAEPALNEDTVRLQVVTERSVERALLAIIHQAEAGEQLDMAAFYLSDRQVIRALREASLRGAHVRVLLDANKDAFGREKNGVPNRPVAHELVQAGVDVRWCATNGEQCHSKWVYHENAEGQGTMLLGSTNFTRRNLHNLNLETSVVLSGALTAEPLAHGKQWFDNQWQNVEGKEFSLNYEVYANASLWYRLLYRVMEATGLSTF